MKATQIFRLWFYFPISYSNGEWNCFLQATEALKITAAELYKLKIVDEIIPV